MIAFNPLKHTGEHGMIRFVDLILQQAIEQRASDTHIEPIKLHTRIRFRIDGELCISSLIPAAQHTALISRLKILAGLDIAEKRLPQDGKFQFPIHVDSSLCGKGKRKKSKATDEVANKWYDCRVSTCPTIHGEKAVIRLLNANQQALALDQLGLTAEQLTCLDAIIKQPYGLILVTGPTGSGKTFTLYSILNVLNQESKNIITIEDPVEIQLDGITQVNTHRKAGLTFAKALRAFLRQDPDIIMVGEIRDQETAEIALKAAQTGHLVLATLHTNSAKQAITRLRDMGIDRELIAYTVSLVIAQRLVRPPRGVGRTGLFELLPIDDTFRQDIIRKQVLG